jgi:alkanesulfonate monooxygenase SsuD/methylene tetrahydromethanopterin reductase-like flavin-dependent oxidoreductase (luciferase family)
LSGDGLLRLSAAAGATSRIGLGIGVIPLHEHDAAAIVRDLAAYRIPVERLRLGIGSGPIAGSLDRVRTATRELRHAVECELTIAALGPRMCKLAGEIADSVLLNWLDPDHARGSVEMVREAARRAGRPTPRVYAYVRVAYGPGSDVRLEREARLYSSLPFYAAHFERMGLKASEVAIHAATPTELSARLDTWSGVVDEVIIRALPGQDTIADTLAILDASIQAMGIVK